MSEAKRQNGAMFDPAAKIPWDLPVEIFSSDTGIQLDIVSKQVTLRQAVEIYLGTPEDGRFALGVGIHEPFLTYMHGRPVAIGFLNASALGVLADRLKNDGRLE